MTRHLTIVIIQMLALCMRTGASRRVVPALFALPPQYHSSHPKKGSTTTRLHSSSTDTDTNTAADLKEQQPVANNDEEVEYIPPWSEPKLKNPSSKAFSRFRQHVNPLARRYQMQADLTDNWPHSDYTNVNLPLYLDIGCGKGGFLLELGGRRHGQTNPNIGDDSYMNSTKEYEDTTDTWLPSKMNYLGLEIRPGVSQYAQQRVEKRYLSGLLSFVGCNANVDLDRLLTLYQESTDDKDVDENNRLAFVSIQFPDPHFKKGHIKRRVVTPALVKTLAKFMKEGDVVFLQSDICDALEAMREQFVIDDGELYFDEHVNAENEEGQQQEYGMANPLGIPTEREVSVLKKGDPIFRTLFKRNGVVFDK